VNVLTPGQVGSPMLAKVMDEEAKAQFESMGSRGESGRPEEIASALCSSCWTTRSYVNGNGVGCRRRHHSDLVTDTGMYADKTSPRTAATSAEEYRPPISGNPLWSSGYSGDRTRTLHTDSGTGGRTDQVSQTTSKKHTRSSHDTFAPHRDTVDSSSTGMHARRQRRSFRHPRRGRGVYGPLGDEPPLAASSPGSHTDRRRGGGRSHL